MNNSTSLSTIPGAPDQAFSPISSQETEAGPIPSRIDAHPGMFALRRFGEQLRAAGADAFVDGYGRFFAALTERISASTVRKVA